MEIRHFTFSADGRRAIFPSESSLCAALRTMLRVAGATVLLFCIVDDHVHIVVACPAAQVGHLARALLLALRARTDVVIAPAHVKVVDSRSYLLWLVDYVLSQPKKHGLPVHPALWSGSCFLDIAGARVLPGWAPPFREFLPRWRRREAFEIVGLQPVELDPLDDGELSRLGLPRLVSASAAACGADPALRGRSIEVVTARRVAAALAEVAGATPGQLAAALGTSGRTARRLRASSAPAAATLAARRRLALELRVSQLLR